jgi:hypothetical protein
VEVADLKRVEKELGAFVEEFAPEFGRTNDGIGASYI